MNNNNNDEQGIQFPPLLLEVHGREVNWNPPLITTDVHEGLRRMYITLAEMERADLQEELRRIQDCLEHNRILLGQLKGRTRIRAHEDRTHFLLEAAERAEVERMVKEEKVNWD